MVDRPIIFSGPMVRALLNGRKTQTRRVLNPQPEFFDVAIEDGRGVGRRGCPDELWPFRCNGYPDERDFLRWAKRARAPYGVGDRLYVREAWAPLAALTHNDPGARALSDRGFYRADESTVDGEIDRWRPSIHMPRWASRLTLLVTDVRVERLNDITNEDCIAEGIPVHSNPSAPRVGPVMDDFARKHGLISHYGDGFRRLWNSINGPDAWAANPWVVAVTFTVHHANIDALDIAARAA